MTLEEVSYLMPGDKIFAYVTLKSDKVFTYATPQNVILNLEIVSNDNKNIICKSDTQYYTIPYYIYYSIGRTFEECLCNIINVIRKSDLEEKYGKKYPEYFI